MFVSDSWLLNPEVNCEVLLTESVRSALSQYCKRCFVAEAAISQCKKSVSGDTCLLCAIGISADNKSPVKSCCFFCYEDQSKIEAALEHAGEQEDALVPLTSVSPSPDNLEVHSEKPLVKEKALPASPPQGWQRQSRESELNWFARVQQFRHGSNARRRKDYQEQWKAWDEHHRHRFRKDIDSLIRGECGQSLEGEVSAVPLGPAEAPEWQNVIGDKAFLVLPKNFSLADLVTSFERFAENPAAHDQKRWEMYGLLHLLLKNPASEIRNPCAAAASSTLKVLRINKHYLYSVRKMFPHDELPWDCPTAFRMGRTPSISLSDREKEDIFLYVKWNARTGTPLDIDKIQDAITVMKLQKAGALDDQPSLDVLVQRVAANRDKHRNLWKDYKKWVAANKPKSEQLVLTNVKVKTVQEVACCTPPIIAQAFDDIEAMLTRVGLLKDGFLTEEAGGRLLVLDEKGFSSRTTCFQHVKSPSIGVEADNRFSFEPTRAATTSLQERPDWQSYEGHNDAAA